MTQPPSTPRVTLIVGGGIAAYKACELIRTLRGHGIAVECVLTDGGARFITPMTLAALSGQPVHTSLWDYDREAEMGHIQLSRRADLLLVCPATADLMARMAGGQADDLATTLLLATDAPVLLAPAMNVRMWTHPATVRNVARLRADGITILDPDDGPMACGEVGPGRLPDPARIAGAVLAMLAGQGPPTDGDASPTDGDASPADGKGSPMDGKGAAPAPPAADPPAPLAGRHILVTAGPTHEPIDPVRYLANRSSGRQGFAIAAAAARAGARVTLVAGPVALETPPGVDRIDVETARDMAAATLAALPADAAILVAAVADWRAADPSDHKLKKDGPGAGDGPAPLRLVENPDILATLARHERRPRLLVGFAAETQGLADHAIAKRRRKGCDWLVANDVLTDPMGGPDNRVHLVTEAGIDPWPRMTKDAVATRLIARIADALADA